MVEIFVIYLPTNCHIFLVNWFKNCRCQKHKPKLNSVLDRHDIFTKQKQHNGSTFPQNTTTQVALVSFLLHEFFTSLLLLIEYT